LAPYINGDNNVENLKKDGETWKVRIIELKLENKEFAEE
jgi:hypothetical protein